MAIVELSLAMRVYLTGQMIFFVAVLTLYI